MASFIITGEVEGKRISQLTKRELAQIVLSDITFVIDDPSKEESEYIDGDDLQKAISTDFIYQPTTQPEASGGTVLLNCNDAVQAVFRPRLTLATRTINANFTQTFSNDSDIVDIQVQYVFTGTIIITMEAGKVQVVEETLPSIYSWDSGLEQLTIEAGTDDKVELNYFRDPDDSGKYTLVCGGVAV